ncbi:MAG: hypothetical protein ACQEXJ_17585 [Myxococcota bacterium]
MASGARSGIWVWLAVFVVGFAIGYGLMALFVKEPVPSGPRAVGEAADEPREVPSVETPVSDERLTAEATPTRAGGADAGEARAETPPPVAAEEADAGPTEETPDAEAAEEESEEESEEPAPWWEACRGEVCVVDFGEITGGLLVRRGKVEHGATVDWDEDFGDNPRLDVLPTEGAVRARLHAVAFDAEGEPIAAELTWRKGDEDVSGVISLDLGSPGKQVSLRPPKSD